MDMIFSICAAIPGSVSQGVIWGIMALGVYITFKILDFADLTVDSSICTGGAVSAMLIINGMHPLLTLLFSALAGMLAGAVTGLLNTKCKIPAILSGILTQLGLYSINMRIMSGKANQSLIGQKTMISLGNVNMAILVGVIVAVVVIAFLYWFFGTEIGCSVRATGNNRKMVRAQGVNTNTTKMIALMLSNGLVGFAGGLLAQYQGYADINMGRGAIVIGLAGVIIGSVLFGRYTGFAYKLASVVAGAVIYFIVIAAVLQLGATTSDLKLISAVFVVFALSLPHLQANFRAKRKSKTGEATSC